MCFLIQLALGYGTLSGLAEKIARLLIRRMSIRVLLFFVVYYFVVLFFIAKSEYLIVVERKNECSNI